MKIRQRVNRLNIAAIGGSHIEVVRRCRAYAEVYCRASLRNGRNYTNPFGRRPKRADCAECIKLRVRRSSRDPNLILGDWQPSSATRPGHRSPPPEQFVGDSPLEGDGFELLVPRHKSRGFPQHSGHLGVSAGLLNGSAFLLLRFEPLHRARLGHGLSGLWLAGLRGGFRLLAVKLRYTFARRSWLRRSTFSAGDSPSDPPASNWRVTRSRSVSSNSSRATVIKAPRRAPHRRHRRR